jgi:hypothetical protein
MSYINSFNANLTPSKKVIDPKAYQNNIKLQFGENVETGQAYTFQAYVAVTKMQKRLDRKPTIMFSLTFWKFKFHLQTRRVDLLLSSFRKLHSWLDTQEAAILTALDKETIAHEAFELESLSKKVNSLNNSKP